MKILSHHVYSGGQSEKHTTHQIKEKLEVVSGSTRITEENSTLKISHNSETDMNITDLFRNPESSKDIQKGETTLLPGLQIMRAILEKFFGVKFELPDEEEESQSSGNQVIDGSSETQPDWGMRYQYEEVQINKEKVNFNAKGSATTDKGEKFEFSLELEMAHETRKEMNFSFSAGKLTDPLVINYNRQGAALSEDKFSFDINSDGKKELLPELTSASGFLVLDRNGNGKIDDGRELFGPTTGNGFEELRKFDSDGNDWIDENDPVYFKLSVWHPGKSDADLSSMKDANIGAIYLNSSDTEFTLEGGRLKRSSIYLDETGKAGIVQEIDLENFTEEEINTNI